MSSDRDRSGGGNSETRPPSASRKHLKSKKLDRTLQELETAFADWENLNSAKARQDAIEEDRRKAVEKNSNEDEFRKKTKKLLNQLRQQLTELND